MRKVFLLAIALCVSVPAAGAELAPNQTFFLGRGVPHWRIGTEFRTEPDLVRFERHPKNDGGGCVAGPVLASRIDYYPGVRLSWYFYDGHRSLLEVATRRSGDRSAVGFVIGQARFRQVRARYPRADVVRRKLGRYRLGRFELVVYHRTGYESGRYMEYWFRADGVLAALATGESGC